jgi:hypothetical protein
MSGYLYYVNPLNLVPGYRTIPPAPRDPKILEADCSTLDEQWLWVEEGQSEDIKKLGNWHAPKVRAAAATVFQPLSALGM